MQNLLNLTNRDEKPFDLPKIGRWRNDRGHTRTRHLILLRAQGQVGVDAGLGELDSGGNDASQIRALQPVGDSSLQGRVVVDHSLPFQMRNSELSGFSSTRLR